MVMRLEQKIVPYRCYFQQLKDGSWLGEDWRALGVSAVAPTLEECQARLRDIILEDARYILAAAGRDASTISLSDLHEERKSAEEVEFSVSVPQELEAAHKRSKRSQA